MADRFYAEVNALQVLRNLTAGTHNPLISEIKSKPFSELKYAFLWAVALGVQEKRRTPLQGSREGVFFASNLDDDQRAFLFTIAIAETNDLKVIGDEGLVQQICEEYANTGVITLRELVNSSAGDPLWKLVDLVRTETRREE